MTKFKKKLKIALLVIVLLFGALAVAMSMTNPSNSDHLSVISDYLNNYDWSQVELTEEQQAQYTAFMSSGANANIMDKEVKPAFQVNDYGLWSVGTLKGKDVTLGMFNKVVLLDGEDIPKLLIDRAENNDK
jgi:hypothetical protein